ncbi:MAG: tRNA 2-thiouridine(34) synthase MnmA [Deltaproteobacteria bacterium]|nr:tRNA 2-thiouridine(34) synthase MnmA [Deltaproteobacteria bacterium]
MAGDNKNTRVAVAMSGGVDSSVAAVLLKEAGYDVIGITMALWSCHKGETARKKTCCSLTDVQDARAVCERIGIPHVVADYRTEFREKVIDHFVSEYKQARTPIPCIGCNQYFKFERLWQTAHEEYGAEFIATGHYARIADNGSRSLLKGRDTHKDQSYFLFVMTPEQLRHSLFPVGGLTKAEVREIAARHGLATAEKIESQEICFVPDNDYAGFIEDYYPEAVGAPGAFVDQDGSVIGRHRGTHAYTIGQRRGLGVAVGERQYVTAIDPVNGQVKLGREEELYRAGLTATGMNWIVDLPREFAANAKIRYKHVPAPCQVRILDDGATLVDFTEPQRAITPGQAVVFYDGDTVLGGGWIERAV